MGVPLSDVNQTLQIYLGSSSRRQFQRLRPALAGDSPGVGRVSHRDRRHRPAPGAKQPRADGSSGRAGQGAAERWPAVVAALQPPHRRRRHGEPRKKDTARARSSPSVEELAREKLPLGMGTEWTELMFLQIHDGNTTLFVFGLAVLCVFLALAALYESWTMPLAVILVVPLCVLCLAAGLLDRRRRPRHLRADRPGGVGGAGVQERDSGRGVRPATAPRRQVALRRGPGSVPAATAAHPDDFVRVHHRRRPADRRPRERGRRCAGRWGRPCSAA